MSQEKIQYIYSKRKSVSLQLKPDCGLLVRVPYGTSQAFINAFLTNQESWIETQRRKLANIVTIPEIDAETEVILREHTKRKANAWLAGWIGPKPKNLYIKNQKSRWGSCSSLGNVNLNLRLGLLPDELFEYVLVHELCHLVELNHSDRFWAEVGKYLPDYRQRRARLKKIRFT